MVDSLVHSLISVCEWETVNASRAREQRGGGAAVHSLAQAPRLSHLRMAQGPRRLKDKVSQWHAGITVRPW